MDATGLTVPHAALEETDPQFRLAFDEAPIGIALVAPDGRFLWVNSALCAIVGYQHGDLLARTFQDLTVPEDLDADLEQLRAVIAGTISCYSMEKRYIRSDATEVPVQLDVSLVRWSDGTPRCFISHVQDISVRRATEEALGSATDALRVSHQRFAALVERSSDIICVFDEMGGLIYGSPAGERLLGYAPGSQEGTPFASLVHPDDLERLAEVFAALLAEPGGVRTAEIKVLSATGEWRHMEVVAANRLADPAVNGIVANVRDVTERAEAAGRLSWQAFHDVLTGLPNRALLSDRLGQAVARGRRAGEVTALLFLDLDRFKLVNDSFGHDAGDQLLVEVAQRLSRVVRDGDTVARLGGDEFVILLERVLDIGEVTRLAERVGAAVAEPVELVAGPVTITVSVGIALDGGLGGEHLLRDADTALYRAKERGRNRYQVFNDALRAAAVRRMAVEQNLRDALANDHLAVHYQPIVDLADGSMAGAEALLRVPGPGGTLESPADHIGVADESGLIVPIGALVLEDACASLVRWRDAFGSGAPGHVSLNVSGRQLAASTFTDLIRGTLNRHGLVPGDLVLEFTESTVIGADRSTLRAVNWLHEQGVGLSVDDFGTGYSSLAYLKRFPITWLKLDRTFVAGLGSDASDTEIVKAVVSLGQSLGLSVVAEGIETPDQLHRLRELGCSCGQGYLLARPTPADALVPGPLTALS